MTHEGKVRDEMSKRRADRKKAAAAECTPESFRTYTVIGTHENVSISYENASAGSRFAAALIDMFIRAGFWSLALGIAAAVFYSRGLDFEGEIYELFESIAMMIMVIYLSIFLVRALYYTLFELFWRGTTPGKRAVGIRVVSVTGEAPSFSQILVRNVMRFFHLLPGGDLADSIVILYTAHAQRAGDLVAGTMVIRDRRSAGLDELVAGARRDVDNAANAEETDGGADPILQAAEIDYTSGAMRNVLAPGAYLTWNEVDMLGGYLFTRAKLEDPQQYDERMLAMIAKKNGELPELPTTGEKLRFMDFVFGYNRNIYLRQEGGEADNDGNGTGIHPEEQ